MRVLIAEDERDMNRLLCQKLSADGYSVDAAYDGGEALDALAVARYDAVVLDIMMPRVDGLEVVRRMRAGGDMTPVLILTARDSVDDRVKGLDLGANDYLVKPFSFDELTARLRAMTRALYGLASDMLSAGDLTLDRATRTVTQAGTPVELTAREYALLEYLMCNKGIVLSREQILNHVWSFDYTGASNVVDVYIRYLRKKIESAQDAKLIHTVRGMGYVLREE